MKNASIKEVAKLAGVSIATVSRCANNPERVSEETRLRVQAAIAETGYVPHGLARNLRRGRTNIVMVVIPSIGVPFFGGVMQGIQSAARAEGLSVIIEETQFNTIHTDKIGAMLVSRQVDGLILLATVSPFGTEILSNRSKHRIPIVVGCETVSADLASLPSVHIDNITAAKEATLYLASQGHRRIALISGEQGSLLTSDRESGYRLAMREAHLPIEDGWLLHGNLTFTGAMRATRMLIEHPERPTAIFCLNDDMALACVHEIKRSGLRVPGDISVMGFDDNPYSELADPPLTTVRQPAAEIGERTLYRLVREIEGRKSHGDGPEYVPHALVVRQSVGNPTE